MPKSCDLTKFEPEPTPSKICEDHYKKSKEVLETVFHTVKDINQVEAMIECVRTKMKIVEPNKEAICFYTGFRPNNIVSEEELEKQLRDDGFVKGEDGKWTKDMGIEEVRKAELNVNSFVDAIQQN